MSNIFFQHKECEYFPDEKPRCHDVEDASDFNCMFCYCPFYSLDDCPGVDQYTDEGVRDCTECCLPHKGDMLSLMDGYMFGDE